MLAPSKSRTPGGPEQCPRAEQRAQADYLIAHLDYTRLLSVNTSHPGLVAQQDVDAARSKDLAMKANVTAAQADVAKYRRGWIIPTSPPL